MFWQVTIGITAAVEECCDTSASKGTLSEVSLVMRALAALATAHDCASHIVVVVVAVVIVLTASAIISLNGVILVSGIPTLVTVIILLFLRASRNMHFPPDNLALRLFFTNHYHTGILTGGRRYDDRGRGRGFLDDDLLRLRSALSNDDGSGRRRRVIGSVIFCLLAVSLDFAAMSIVNVLFNPLLDAVLAVVATLDALLDSDVILKRWAIKPGTSLPVAIHFLLKSGRTGSLSYSYGRRRRSCGNRCRRRNGHRWRWISLSLDLFLVNVGSRGLVPATILIVTGVRRGSGIGLESRARAVRGIGTTVFLEQVTRGATIMGGAGPSIVKLGYSFGSISPTRCDLVSSDCGLANALVVRGAVIPIPLTVDASVSVDFTHRGG
jgi:hypothetical protein